MSETDEIESNKERPTVRCVHRIITEKHIENCNVEDAIFSVEELSHLLLLLHLSTYTHRERFSSCAKFRSDSRRSVRILVEQLVFILILIDDDYSTTTDNNESNKKITMPITR